MRDNLDAILDDIDTIMALPNPSPVDEIEADFDTIALTSSMMTNSCC